MTTETIVLGAGIVGVSVALHLQERGHSVVLIDRSAPGEGASYGNAGLLERSSVVPYAIPRDLKTLLSYATNRNASVHYDPAYLPRIMPWLLGYWNASQPARLAKIASELLPLIEACLDEHDRLVEASGMSHLVRRQGWLEVVRSDALLAEAAARAVECNRDFGLNIEVLDRAALARLEPSLKSPAIGAVHWKDPFSVTDPGALTKGYAALFEKRGGTLLRETVTGMTQEANGWRVTTDHGTHTAQNVVVAFGAHSGNLLADQGYKVPLVGKRGHHLHFRPEGGATLNHPILDEVGGYVLAPMAAGIRLTTGVELAAPDAPANRIQIDQTARFAREIFALGTPVEDKPWLGLRPATPDMKPVIGPAPRHRGLWLAFGHAHHGLTLGPATGRLLAEMMTGEKPFADPKPFDVGRFL